MEQQNFSQPSSAQQPSQKSIKPFWPIILLVLVIVLVGVLLWQKNNANQAVDVLQKQIISLQNKNTSPAGKIVATTSDEIVGWKTYKNNSVGIELKYPPDYIIKENSAAGPFWLNIYIGVSKIFTFTQTNWVHEGEGKPDIIPGFSREVVVDGIIGHTRVVESMKDGSYLYVTPIKKDNKIYEFWGDGLIFDKILSTFKFTK